MKARVGDFLVVKGTTTERHDQHAEIIEVRSQDGSPPYVVRWLVTDHEATVYPGSDAGVVTAAEHTQAGERPAAGPARVGTYPRLRLVDPKVVRISITADRAPRLRTRW